MEIDETWECYLCSADYNFEDNPKGYIANYHPLCINCADNLLNNENNQHRLRLTYHYRIGDIMMIGNIPVENSYPKLN
jgi:hypothetical protein